MLFYRGSIFSGFDLIAGDPGDARFVMAICEHWLMVLQGLADWRDPAFFHPVKGVLGYSDALFLYLPIYALARVVGADVYLAFQATLMTLNAIGYLAFITLATRYLRVGAGVAILGALLFVFANNLYLVAGHPQLYAIYLVPVWLVLVCWAWETHPTRPALAMARGIIAGLFFALLLYTSYYIGWFLALAVLCFSILWLLPCGGIQRISLPLLRQGGGLGIGMGLGFTLGIVPFLLTYMPVLAQGFRRDPEAFRFWTGTPLDLLNVGTENWLWGWSVRGEPGAIGSAIASTELSIAVTPMVTLMATMGSALLVSFGLPNLEPRSDREARRLLAAACLTFLVLLVLPIRWGEVAPWAWVMEAIPGAIAVRAMFRVELLAGLVACLLVTVILSNLAGHFRVKNMRRVAMPVIALLGTLLLIEQINTLDVTHVDRRAGLDLLKGSQSMPKECTSFVLGDVRPVGATHPVVVAAAQQIDAILIGQALALPTINGYSGQIPRGWMQLDPRDSGFIDKINRWSAMQGDLPGLCIYGRRDDLWVLPQRRDQSG